ncbi:hypothetical protein CY0110_19287 [Crocosphaera chwakensis CCY0110]|uniref:Uncharacterized protein n=1 Tax=Crocosphaera chwakensis CCY0110 TaxID=391612 RepID=A3IJI9_9CHRO|nr:hypothetical protein CY0110_19287 [Crocosphaera chwakensis CCY0110]
MSIKLVEEIFTNKPLFFVLF